MKHYFILNFPQRPGALREFVNDVLGPQDDITKFEYLKKSSQNTGTVIIGIQLSLRSFLVSSDSNVFTSPSHLSLCLLLF
ncbi:hypothetical protein L895_13405 [Staphylococcus aureus SA16]|nr:hypothetical protein L895_13405 [Staphylococcus aureus SA16]